jgi:hypothetical protein
MKAYSIKVLSVLLFSLLTCISILVGSRSSRAQTPAQTATYDVTSDSGIEAVLGSPRFGLRGIEIRNFLATNEAGELAVDLKYRYDGGAGWRVADTMNAATRQFGSRSRKEFYIRSTANGFDGTNEVLNFYEPNAHQFCSEDNSTEAVVKQLPFLYVAPQNNVYCDFIYGLDGTEAYSRDQLKSYPDQPIFYLKYTALFLHGASVIKFDTITYCKWSAYNDSLEHPFITHFPKERTHPSERYAILRTTLPTLTNTPDTIASIACEVHSLYKVGMYVRGLRMRTPNADSILHGYRDAALNRYFDTIQGRTSRITTPRDAAYSGAFAYASYRVMAYADLLFYKRYGKPLFAFPASDTDNTYAQYRSIFKDQNGLDPSSLRHAP